MSALWASVPCHLHYRHGVALLLEALLREAAQRVIYQVVSAFNEAFSNVVAHSQLGGEHLLEIEARIAEDTLELRLRDDGVPYDPVVEQNEAPLDPLALDEGGLGLLLMNKCMDEIRYERTDKNELIMVKRIIAGEPSDCDGAS
jgi:anti-sigma regulatory factor (Ser/Thr protein kinase)